MNARIGHHHLLVVGAADPDKPGCLRALTESPNYTFDEAQTADDAIAMAGRRRPSLIVLNLDGRERHGLEICQALVNADTTRNVPILAIAGAPSDRQFMIALAVKECDTETLDAEIQRMTRTVH